MPSNIQPDVTVSSSQRRLSIPARRIRDLVAFVAARQRVAVGMIDIHVVGERRMAAMNRRFLGHDGPTDVLSFDLGDGPAGGLCGQIVVCSDVAIRQARRRGHAAWRELMLYITHGLLHLMGHDDHAEADARRMHRRENELLEAFGAGRVYGEP
ncbi:MAG: rRNA maturation RNase YbeY [Planctomycetes bacterium]|nr:rRNA maturation RNase YbeY [Planctomycetota bacterium]